MNLLVLLIVFGVQQLPRVREPAAVLAGLVRHWRDYWIERGRRESWPPLITLALMIFFPLAFAGLLFFFLDGVWHRAWEALVSLVIMALVLLDRAQPGALQREQAQWAATPWQADIDLTSAELLALEHAAHGELLRAQQLLLREQLHELFAPVCWFLLFGPLAALIYYFLRLAATVESRREESSEVDTEKNIEEINFLGKKDSAFAQNTVHLANKILDYANWPVVRLLSLSFALAGDFLGAWESFRRHVFNQKINAVALLSESCTAAHAPNMRLQNSVNPNTVLIGELTAVNALLHRALIIWIVLLALHTLWPS